MVYQRNCANHVQKGEEYLNIPFFEAGITFFTEVVDRRVLWKRVCGSQQVGESPSLSQHSTVRRKRVNRESVESGQMCLFVEGVQHHSFRE